MRLLILALALSTLALGGCGKKQATGNTSAIDQGVIAEDFTANDATAIDAATGADANMAADVDINLYENTDNDSAAAPSRARPRAPTRSNDDDDNAEPVNTATTEPAPPPAEVNTN